MTLLFRCILASVLVFLPVPAFAAAGLNGAEMSLVWAIPFVGVLLSIATGPLLFHRTWEHHYGKIAAAWAVLLIVPLIAVFGFQITLETVLHALILEYMSFIIVLFALFTIAGGILVTGNLRGTPLTNVGLLGIGTVLASFVGTTGASMIMIRPVIRANDDRIYNVHVVIFFIFLVSNIGGALTPLGDPPLFVGFLRGVDFFWTTQYMFTKTLLCAGVVMLLFYVLDSYYHRKEARLAHPRDPTPDRPIKLWGTQNILLLGGVVAAILMSAYWKPGINIAFPGGELPLQSLVRDVTLLGLAGLSLLITPKQVRAGNEFSWGPILEVAKLFAAIFVCIAPVLAILKAGPNGALAPLVALVTRADGSADPLAYFWMSGLLSSFLDNAPTYLVFFELAGGDPAVLMTTGSAILVAISAGAVFMGANTYIGNAPNFMVYAIAKDMKVKMPSFFGYMLWSGAVLIPTFVLLTFVFFWR